MSRLLTRLLLAWWRLPTFLRWGAVGAEMALIWWLSSRPLTLFGIGFASSLLHNSMHVVAYGAMAAMAALAANPAAVLSRRGLVLAVLTAAAYGLVDELHQGQVPGRVCSIADWGADCSGAVLAVAVLARWMRQGRASGWAITGAAVLAGLCVGLATCTEL